MINILNISCARMLTLSLIPLSVAGPCLAQAAPVETHAAPKPDQGVSTRDVTSVTYLYGNFWGGYKSYALNPSTRTLIGVWDWIDFSTGVSVRYSDTKILSAQERRSILSAISRLSVIGTRTEQDPCTADGEVFALILEVETKGQTDERIYVTPESSDVCIVGSKFVSQKSMDAVQSAFKSILPERPSPFPTPE